VEVINLKGVTQRFKKVNILDNVNLAINQGDMLGVIGQSGSGKTTLLNLITGFIQPTDGDVVYYSKIHHEERSLTKNLNKVKKHIGFTPQHNSFYPKLTVMENLLHFGRLYGLDKKTLKDNIKNLLEFTHLSHHKKKLAEHLSGGMQKRLDISCSLVHRPKILVLDEPTADLDPVLQKEILHLLQEVNKQGITVVFASHHLESIEKICNKVVIINDGRVHSYGSLDEIRAPFMRDHFRIKLPKGADKEHIIERLRGLPIKNIVQKRHSLVITPTHVGRTMNELMEIIKDEGLQLNDLHFKKASLNEVFEKIVEGEK
jgi:ABC-2 type transport system ATP-binding protein